MSLAVAVIIVFVGIFAMLFAYTFVYYPVMSQLNQSMTDFGMHTPETLDFMRLNFYTAAAVAMILSFGLMIWVIARITKREEYEWR